MIALASSNLSGADYAVWTATLTIAFHGGRVYEYYDVPDSVFDGLLNAESHGKYFHAHIKNRYQYQRLK